ncbi:type II secretion system protein GspC [Ectothiorhodospiraceae bacterium WFHF3C12]|nr:type II secretion system protein GspC [Ectothiorhodospiraceae bacterium WFHF3C12]
MQGILGRIPPQVSTQTQQRIQRLAVLVLVVLLAHGLARLTWTLWPTATTLPPTPSAPGTGSNGGQSQAGADLDRVAALHLFGEADQQPRQQREAPVDAPETQLNLTLSGVLYNEDQDAARAIIAGARGPEKFYRIGDQLPGGATLDAIYKDRVILLRNGRHETLRLPEDREGTAVESYGSGSRQQSEPRVSAGGNESLSDYRQQLLEDPAKIQQYLQGRPEMRNGEMVGFRVEPGSNPRMFQMTGLQPGDIVTAVGNVQIDSPDKGFQVFDELSRSDSVTLTVIRDGSTTQIPINFQN